MKLLKKIIWDFHTKNILTRNGGPDSLNESTDICDLFFDTLLLVALCFTVYTVIVGLPVYFISAIMLCCFVGRGEMAYVDLPVDLLVGFAIVVVICGVACLLWLILFGLFKAIRKVLTVICKKLNIPTFKVRDKVCFKVDFSDMEKNDE